MVAVDARLEAGFDGTNLFDLSAAGVFKITADGIAGKLRMREDVGQSEPLADYFTAQGLDVDMNASFDVLINTTENESIIELPDNFDAIAAFDVSVADAAALTGVTGNDVVDIGLDDELTVLSATPGPTALSPDRIAFTLTVPNTRLGQQAKGEFYILIRGTGEMIQTGFEITGTFDIIVEEQFAVMAVNAVMTSGYQGQNVFELQAVGVFKIDNAGLSGKTAYASDTGATRTVPRLLERSRIRRRYGCEV